MKQKNFRLVWLIIAVIMLAFVPKEVRAQEETLGAFTVTKSDGGECSFANNKLTVTAGTVKVSTTAQTNQTIVLEGTAKLILDGVNINAVVAPPIEVAGNDAVIELAKSTQNTLESKAADYAGIHVPVGSKVTFTGSGELETKNSTSSENSSCAIGGQQSGNNPYSCGTVIFNLDGKITAQGGSRGAGIGTCIKIVGAATVFGSIIIKNGTINAKGGDYAAGIGTGPDGGAGGCVNILIEGGTVTASGGNYASEIGNGLNSQAVMYITVTGGEIKGNIGKGNGGATSLEQVIVGPDAKVNGKISGYANGIVFSSDPKTATMTGNVTIPSGVTLTIDADETLTFPAGQTLTIEDGGAIINNGGTITYNGTIKYERTGLKKENYGTICLPYAVAENDRSGAEFFSIAGKKIENGSTWLVLEEVEGDLNAGQPYIFKATADKLSCTYSMNNAVESPGNENGLIGSFEQVQVSGSNYVLKDNVIYKCSTEKTWNIAANRAYINMEKVSEYNPDAPSSANHVVNMRVSGGTTGIDAVRTEQQDGVYYNMQGQRVASPSHGIYIVNGKKVIMK